MTEEISLRSSLFNSNSAEQNQDVPYHLRSVVYHSGRASSGHYTACCRRKVEVEGDSLEEWVSFDDKVGKGTTFNHVTQHHENKNCYLALYYDNKENDIEPIIGTDLASRILQEDAESIQNVVTTDDLDDQSDLEQEHALAASRMEEVEKRNAPKNDEKAKSTQKGKGDELELAQVEQALALSVTRSDIDESGTESAVSENKEKDEDSS